ncbi:hypothetical protein SAMN04487948_101199 [Halogranum amylolyticum]|uniref:Pectate lyase superfamily protein n=1 Tax=Halogranum amylolyticum TaxID=660520 RepID=A0A1H8MZ47_9EURY|nr:hypothetical protein [Halogranum amylolyticum]SEO22627.1 hypothetical protein SAMN04487948_101199 [Halogranum amylolyticum]
MAREPADGSQQRGASSSEKPFLNRREYLRLGATATAVGTVSAATMPTSVAAASSTDHVFNDRLNAVDDLGMDPTGEEAIDDALTELPDETLVAFPAGEYLVTDEIETDEEKRVGIEPAAGATDDVRFVVDASSEDASESESPGVLSSRSDDDLAADSAERDASADGHAGSTLLVYREASLELRRVDLADFDSATTFTGGNPKTLTIVGPDDGVANYRLTVSDRIDARGDEGTQQSAGLPSTSVEDAIGDTRHSYRYTGEIASFRLDGEATVLVDGQEVVPEELAADGPLSLPELLVFDAREADSGYELRVAPRDDRPFDADHVQRRH